MDEKTLLILVLIIFRCVLCFYFYNFHGGIFKLILIKIKECSRMNSLLLITKTYFKCEKSLCEFFYFPKVKPRSYIFNPKNEFLIS